MPKTHTLSVLTPLNRMSVADSVYDELHRQILTLELKPGAKISEADVARALAVSRQPVRDAFYRLSKLGFLNMRPQVATTISLISKEAVMQARFIRSAIEVETVKTACDLLNEEDLDMLEDLLERQSRAMKTGEAEEFHALDDQFHKEICDRAGLGFAWDLIRENKAHMDRVRFLTLAFASQSAFGGHVKILKCLRARDKDEAAMHMQAHLSEIKKMLPRIRQVHPDYFVSEQD